MYTTTGDHLIIFLFLTAKRMYRIIQPPITNEYVASERSLHTGTAIVVSGLGS